MGYLVSAHVVDAEVPVECLDGLPASIGFRVLRSKRLGITAIDTFRSGKPNTWPFQSVLPAVDIPLDLPPALRSIDQLARELRKLRIANGLKKSYINFSVDLAKQTTARVFSLVADDDELDFSCVADPSGLCRLTARCCDLLVRFSHGDLSLECLVDEEDELIQTDASVLTATVPGLSVAHSDYKFPRDLHHFALLEWQRFSGISEPILGLGSFDPPEDSDEWEFVFGRS